MGCGMEAQKLLHTEQLSVGYHGKKLIENIEISLKKGEIVTLIGPNGAGKSTILKTITKQLQEISGSVYVENTALKGMPEKELAKKMSIVFTERITPELMTVADVVAMGRYPYTGGLGILTPKDEAVVAQCMEQIRISPLKERNFMSLSDGQKQRVLRAKALCQEPEIIVLDEPTSDLDVDAKEKLARAIAGDGEGASRLITCAVREARSEESAERLAKAVVSSSLVKAAMFGSDANWGRVLCAMGYSKAPFRPEHVDVTFQSQAGSVPVCRQGDGLPFDEDAAKRILSEKEVVILVDLHEGDEAAECWGCDLTYDYVKINGDYRT